MGFEIIDGKVVANSDKDVINISKLFPISTIISMQHGSQMSDNEYFKDYYIITAKGQVEGADYVTDYDISASKNALKTLKSIDHSRNRSRSRHSRTRSEYPSRSRSRDPSRSRSRDPSRGGKRKTFKKSK